MPSPSSSAAASDLVTFDITANGQSQTAESSLEVKSIKIVHALNRIPSATIVLRDGEPALSDFPVAASDRFAPGAQITLAAGYGDKNDPLFSGIIVKTTIRHLANGDAEFLVDCRDRSVAMTVDRKSNCYPDTTDSSLLTTLIGNHALTAKVTATAETHEELTQFAATDWDFLLARAEANGFVVAVADGEIKIGPPSLSAAASQSVTYGTDILDFSLEQDVRPQHSSFLCRAWDPATQAILEATKDLPGTNPLGGDSAGNLAGIVGTKPVVSHASAPFPSAVLEKWASAWATKADLAKIRGTVRFQGNALSQPDTLLSLAGLGDRFDGNAYVSGITHEIADGNWTTEAAIGLDPAWFVARPEISAPPASALLPAVAGLQIGTVKKIDEDPAGHFRVLVDLPTVAPGGQGVWGRLSRPYATDNAGSFFYPETGDEVVLAFLDADPRYPVIVGSLFSSSRPPPLTPDAKNSKKGTITAAQLKLIFDETKKSITLSTPAGNSVEIDDEAKSITLTNESKNKISLTPDGIVLSSEGSITLKAKQGITLSTQASVDVSATADATVAAANISLGAKVKFEAKGNAGANLESPAITVVKGSLVQIN